MNSIRLYGFLMLAALAFASCRNIPEYPAGPQITVNRVDKTVITFNQQPTDKLDFIINFTDGDGDLGLGTGGRDIQPPYQYCQEPFNSDQNCIVVNPDYNNWRMKFLVKQPDGQFALHPLVGNSYSGRFPRLEPEDGEAGPLDGTLTYTIRLEHVFFQPNTVAKFEIQILDRSFNESNVVVTPEVILNEQ